MMNLPNPQPVLDPSEAFRRSKTMFAAVSVGVFEALHEGPASAAELAARLGANADAMARSSDSGGKRREWGICLTQVIALPSAWWGGPPGPRRTPASACWQAGQGAGRGRGHPPHIAPQNAGYLSQADTPKT